MILFLILFICILGELKYASKDKKKYVFFLFCFYLTYCVFDLVYLNLIYNRSFHFSDPSGYFEKASKANSILDIFKLREEETNIFYFIVNYIYESFYFSPWVVSAIVRLDNIALIIYTYLLVSQTTKKINAVDYILMLNPLLLTILARNVRDLYILLFIVLIFLSLKMLPSLKSYSSSMKYWVMALMLTIRPICLIPIAIILLLRFTKSHKILGIVVCVFVLIFFYLNIDFVIQKVVGQFISAATYVGEEENDYLTLYQGEINIESIIPFILRLIKAGVVLIFTPHPINFAETWIGVNNITGIYGIYTKLDCVMITLGALYSYLYIIPRIIVLLFTYKAYKYEAFLYAIIFALIYATAYLGITDIRNHYITYALFLIPMFSQLQDIRVSRNVYFIVGLFFILICKL